MRYCQDSLERDEEAGSERSKVSAQRLVKSVKQDELFIFLDGFCFGDWLVLLDSVKVQRQGEILLDIIIH